MASLVVAQFEHCRTWPGRDGPQAVPVPGFRTRPQAGTAVAAPVSSVGRAAHSGSPGGVHHIFVAVFGIRARPAARRVPGSAEARQDLIHVLAEGVAPARPRTVDGATRAKGDLQIGRGLEADPYYGLFRASCIKNSDMGCILFQASKRPLCSSQGTAFPCNCSYHLWVNRG